MLLTDEELQERLESPMNLLNRLKNVTSPSASRSSGIPTMPPVTSEDIKLDIPGKLAATNLRDTAARVMGKALQELEIQLPSVQKPEKLAHIAAEMNKVLNATNDNNKNPPAQIVVYAPQVIQENHFQELVLKEDII